MRKIFGPRGAKCRETEENWINKELHDLYDSANIIQVMETRRKRWVGHVAWMEDKKHAQRILVGKRERGQVADHTQMG